jgi:hypothetical protein
MSRYICTVLSVRGEGGNLLLTYSIYKKVRYQKKALASSLYKGLLFQILALAHLNQVEMAFRGEK